MTSVEKFLKNLRDRKNYHDAYWREPYKQGREDVRYACGNPWPIEEQQNRNSGIKRPMLVFDEVSQYTDQLINSARQNKRAIKITPEGAGANDKTAELDANIIRHIEYKNVAQKAYMTAFQNVILRSYGFVKVVNRWIPGTMDQETCIVSVPNPENITIDPDCRQADYSDMEDAFDCEWMGEREFYRRFPNADSVNYDQATFEDQAAGWRANADGKGSIRVASYWYADYSRYKIIRLFDGSDVRFDKETMAMQDSKLYIAGQEAGKILNDREDKERHICQYITNGMEILEKTPWAGIYIPIIPCFGKQVWVDNGSGSELVIYSLVRNARHPILMYDYCRTSQFEMAGMAPKAPFMGYEGQFEGHEDEFANAHRRPKGYLEVKATTEESGGQTVLPLPQRAQFEPAIQALEILAEASRRAIQAAMGSSPLPTNAQRLDDKSGVALKVIENSRSQGSLHFLDNYDEMIANVGRVVQSQLSSIYNTTREMSIRKEDETNEQITIHNPKLDESGNHIEDEQGNLVYENEAGSGNTTLTIGTGPSQESQREKVNDVAKGLMTPELIGMAFAGNKAAAKICSLNIKLLDLGPIGELMAKIFDPEENGEEQQIPPGMQQALDGLKQETEQLNANLVEMEAKVKEMEFEKQAKIVDNQGKIEIVKVEYEEKAKLAKLEDITKIRVAEINKLIPAGIAAADREAAALDRDLGHAHEAAILAQEQAHQRDIQRGQQIHNEDMSERGHEQGLESADISYQQGIESQELAAQQAAEMAEKETEKVGS